MQDAHPEPLQKQERQQAKQQITAVLPDYPNEAGLQFPIVPAKNTTLSAYLPVPAADPLLLRTKRSCF